MEIDSWSKVAASNVTVGGVDVGEGCPARNLNDGIRATMAGVREVYEAVESDISAIDSQVSDLGLSVVDGKLCITYGE